MHQSTDTPPPPAPADAEDSFHAVSPEVPIDVPPTPRTYGWLAGSLTARADASGPPSGRQPVDPEAPAAARTVCPCVAACSKRLCSDEANESCSSHSPHDVDTTGSGKALLIIARKMS